MSLAGQVASVDVCGIRCGEVPLFLISGPCVIEEEDVMERTAESLKGVSERLGIPVIFKSSFHGPRSGRSQRTRQQRRGHPAVS